MKYCELPVIWNAIGSKLGSATLVGDTVHLKSQMRDGDANWKKSVYLYERIAEENCTDCQKTVFMTVIRMERKFTSYSVQTFLPSFMMVIVSFASLAIPPEQVIDKNNLISYS